MILFADVRLLTSHSHVRECLDQGAVVMNGYHGKSVLHKILCLGEGDLGRHCEEKEGWGCIKGNSCPY